MKVECTDCHKVYNFKNELVPDSAFSFACKQCGGRIRISKEELDSKLAEQNVHSPNETAAASKKSRSSALKKLKVDKLKKPLEKSAQMVAEMSEWSEKDWIYTVTKFAAFFSIACLVALIVFSGLTYYSISVNSRITFAEVQRSVDLKMDPVLKIQAAAPGVKLPGRVKKYFSGDHRPMFIDWMNGLDEKRKQEFIADLDLVIRTAEKSDPTHVMEYINEFGNLSFRRSVEKPYAKYLFKYGMIMAMVASIALLGMFSLILLRISKRRVAGSNESPAPTKQKPRSKRKPQALPKRVTSVSR